jgi:signal transduction histidine kinase
VPAAVLLIALVAWFATDRALRPVERMRAQAAAITAADLDQRLQVPGSRDHLARLAATFNDTLDRLAKAADRQRRFVADAAHELRSPISSMRAILDVALADPDGPDRAALRDAAAEARRLHRLADDLLLLSRLEAGPPPRCEPVDLGALARAQLADRGRVGPVVFQVDGAVDGVAHGAEPATGPAPGPATGTAPGPAAEPTPGPATGPVVAGDAAQLDRLLANLLDNAERHAATRVTVSLHAGPAGDVTLAVSDDGPGIPAADRERIFDRFARLDEARTRSDGGTGLGLAIARDICRRHGGTLTVTAADGGGARFVASLPAALPTPTR